MAPTPPGSRHPLRLLAAWAAMLGLYLQLLAGVICLSSSAPGIVSSHGEGIAWPICHAQAGTDGGGASDDGGQAPVRSQVCAFCLLHCHGTLAAAPVVRWTAPVPIFAPMDDTRVAVARPLSRVATDAAPRGPPTVG